MLKGIDDDDRPVHRPQRDPPRARRQDLAVGHASGSSSTGRTTTGSYNEAGLIPPKDETPLDYESMLYDDDGRADRLRHQLHVLADAAAPHRDGAGPTRPRRGRRHRVNLELTDQPPVRDGRGDVTQASVLQPSAEDGLTCQAWTRTYDAIIVGGGHNGLVNGAYLAKAGLKTLIVERRDMVGGAAITEELRPGFSFTSFSYALSLLRPDIVQELDLVKHGFMPILMPSSFAPMENGDYLLLGQDRDENIKEIMRHSPHDADAMDRYEHDVERVCQLVKPLLDKVAAEHLRQVARGPRGHRRAACSTSAAAEPEGHPRPGPAAHRQRRRLPRRLLRERHPQGLHRLLGDHRHQGRPDVAGLRAWCCSTTRWASTTGTSGPWSFHKGGNGGFTQVLARAAQAYGAEISSTRRSTT